MPWEELLLQCRCVTCATDTCDITNKHNTFCLVRLNLHIFKTGTPNSSALYGRGKAPNYTI